MGDVGTTLAEHLTLIAFLLPVLGAGVILAISRFGLAVVRLTAVVCVLATIVTATAIVARYDANQAGDVPHPVPIQMVSSLRWLGEFQDPSTASNGKAASSAEVITGPDIRLEVGVDGISIWLILLAAVLALPAVVAGSEVDRKNAPAFYALLLLLQAAAIGVFAALDVVLFAICIESASLSMYFLIGYWGSYERRPVARKFYLYNLFGGLLLLLGLIGIVVAHAWITTTATSPVPHMTFSIPRLITEIPLAVAADPGAEEYWKYARPWLFALLLVGVAIKTPLIPFHTWMPVSNQESPCAVNVLYAGIVLRLGCFAFLRFLVPLFPEMLAGLSGTLIGILVVGSLFSALITLGHDDLKRVSTYSCLVQLELCAAAAVTLSPAGIYGSILQLLTNGLAVGGLFFLIGELERQYQTRDVEAFSGLIRRFPRLSFGIAFFALSFIGAPGLAGFPGGWLTTVSLFEVSLGRLVGALAAGLLVVWAYIWLLQRMLLGKFRVPLSGGEFLPPAEAGSSKGESTLPRFSSALLPVDSTERSLSAGAARVPGSPRDLGRRELLALAPVIALLLAIGICPQFFVERIEPTVRQMLHLENDQAASITPYTETGSSKPVKGKP